MNLRRKVNERKKIKGGHSIRKKRRSVDVWRAAKRFCHLWCEHSRIGRGVVRTRRTGRVINFSPVRPEVWSGGHVGVRTHGQKRIKEATQAHLWEEAHNAKVTLSCAAIEVTPGPIRKHLIDTKVSIITLSAQQMLSLTWPWQTSYQPNQTDQMRQKMLSPQATKRVGFIRFACQSTRCLLYCVRRSHCEEISMPSRH